MRFFLLSSISIFFLDVNSLYAKNVVYECRPDEVITTNTGDTINKVPDNKIAIHLTLSGDKIFDGKYTYRYKQSTKYTQGLVKIYEHSQSRNAILFPTFPIEENQEVNIYNVLFKYTNKSVGMYLFCAVSEEINAYRNKKDK